MPRYIDADKVKEALQTDYDREGAKADNMAMSGNADLSVKYNHGQFCYLNTIERIKDAPTEDVVPRSEVEELTIELEAMRCAANSYKLHYEQAKQEVAREIFEEIKNFAKEDIRQRQKYLDNFYGKNSKFNDTRSNWLGGKIDGIKEFMEECIAELQKKHIGE